MLRSLHTVMCVVVVLFAVILPSTHANFLREGFSSKMETDFQNEMKLEDSELANGMSREMFLMKEVEWELQPMDFSSIKDGKLRRHVQSFFDGPVKLKLSSRRGKYGLRAVGQLESGRKLRAFWRQPMRGVSSNPNQKVNSLTMSYDEAVQNRLSSLEVEFQLPPINKKQPKKLPSVVFTVAVEPGTMNAKSILPRGPAAVKILPDGHDAKDVVVTPEGGTAGMSFLSLPMRAGLIDHGWAKGRAVFRKGRSI